MPKKKKSKSPPPIRLNPKPPYRIGYDEDHDYVNRHVNNLFNSDLFGGMLVLIEKSGFITRKKQKRYMKCPMKGCNWQNNYAYVYLNFRWSPVLSHLIFAHRYEPPIHFCNFLYGMISRWKKEV